MISKFTVSNYLSFKDPTSVSFVATAMKEHFTTNVFNSGHPKVNLLRSSAVFGWNSSGKSNVIKSIKFMRTMVLKSPNIGKFRRVSYRLSTECENKPTSFEVEFFMEGLKYIYGFSINDKEVVSEHLFFIRVTAPMKIFERKLHQGVSYGKDGENFKEVIKFTRPESLLLSVAAQFNHDLAGKIVNWFNTVNILQGAKDMDMHSTYDASKHSKYSQMFDKMLKNMSLGFDYIRMRVKDEGGFGEDFKLMSVHDKYDDKGKVIDSVEFDLLERESLGTRKIIALSGHIIKALVDGTILVIDEFDARLHPGLVRSIIMLFHSKDNVNNAQLIIVTHNTSILKKEIYRRDQINVVEKTSEGDSILWSLADKSIRNDAAYDQAYLYKYASLTKSMELDLLSE